MKRSGLIHNSNVERYIANVRRINSNEMITLIKINGLDGQNHYKYNSKSKLVVSILIHSCENDRLTKWIFMVFVELNKVFYQYFIMYSVMCIIYVNVPISNLYHHILNNVLYIYCKHIRFWKCTIERWEVWKESIMHAYPEYETRLVC